MKFSFSLKSLGARVGFALLVFVAITMLAKAVIAEFLAGTLIDRRLEPGRDVLTAAHNYLPDSARLLARLAETEMNGTDKAELEIAETHALEAVNLSPNNYNYQLLLASIRESRLDQEGALTALNEALRLAPNYSEVHWKTANLLTRMGRLNEAIGHFHTVAKFSPELVPAMLDLVWNVSENDVGVLKKIADDTNSPKAQLTLSRFLASRGKAQEAAEIFAKVDKKLALESQESVTFFDSLIKNGYPKLASDLWMRTVGVTDENKGESLIWNGDFDAVVPAGENSKNRFTQFDWQIKDSAYVRVRIDESVSQYKGHTPRVGSLLVDFTEKDTTRLRDEIRKMLVLEPGTFYRLEFFVKTERLQTPEGPRIVVQDKAGKQIGASEAISQGTSDWTKMTLNFKAPAKGTDDGSIVIISVRREPHFVYDEPTKGRIWFDNFEISELKEE